MTKKFYKDHMPRNCLLHTDNIIYLNQMQKKVLTKVFIQRNQQVMVTDVKVKPNMAILYNLIKMMINRNQSI